MNQDDFELQRDSTSSSSSSEENEYRNSISSNEKDVNPYIETYKGLTSHSNRPLLIAKPKNIISQSFEQNDVNPMLILNGSPDQLK